jgi:hypothetical protein
LFQKIAAAQELGIGKSWKKERKGEREMGRQKDGEMGRWGD